MDALQKAEGLMRELHLRRPDVTIPSTAASPMDDRLTVALNQRFIDSCEPIPTETSSAGYLDEIALAALDRAAAMAKLEAEVANGALRSPGRARNAG